MGRRKMTWKEKRARDEKNPKSKLWFNRAYKKWKEYVRLRAECKCEVCGCVEEGKKHNCHHIVTQGAAHHLQTKERNGVYLCTRHHGNNTNGSPHGPDSWKFAVWLDENRHDDYLWVQDNHFKNKEPPDYIDDFNRIEGLVIKILDK